MLDFGRVEEYCGDTFSLFFQRENWLSNHHKRTPGLAGHVVPQAPRGMLQFIDGDHHSNRPTSLWLESFLWLWNHLEISIIPSPFPIPTGPARMPYFHGSLNSQSMDHLLNDVPGLVRKVGCVLEEHEKCTGMEGYPVIGIWEEVGSRRITIHLLRPWISHLRMII